MGVLDIVLILAAGLLFLVGIIGCVIPGLPGLPLCWGGLLIGHFIHSKDPVSIAVLVGAAVACVVVEVVDFIVPSYFTKKSGGSKAGSTGSMLGVLAGVLTGQLPLIFLGPFVGALIGEVIHDAGDLGRALRSACCSFLGFITGTGLKLIAAGCLLVVFIRSLL
jgi:hypothetical protein